MKKACMIIVLLLTIFISSNVYARNYFIELNSDDSLIVKDGYNGPVVDDYSEDFTYSNNILTINENTIIDEILLHKQLSITSNNKPVGLGRIDYVYDDWDKSDVNIYDTKIVTLDNSYRFNISRLNSAKLTNVEADNYDRIEVHKDGIEINNCKLAGGYIVGNGPVVINNSDIQPQSMKIDYSPYIIVNNSHIHGFQSYYTNSNQGYFKFVDSVIESDDENSRLWTATVERKTIIVENSTIRVALLQSDGNTNSAGDLEVKNSTLDVGELNLYKGAYIDNSTLNIDSLRTGGLTNYLNFNNCIVNIKDMASWNITAQRLNLNNTYWNQKGAWTLYSDDAELNIKDSYFNLIGSIIVYGSANINNSYFKIVNEQDELPFAYYSIKIDDGLKLTDINNTELNQKLIHIDDVWDPVDVYELFYSNDELSSSVTLSSKKTITFKIQGGTWADGKTNDIVITKDIWTKLTNDEIPTGMLGDGEGYWKVVPSTEDYIKDDLEFVYVFGKVKGEEEVTNPKTGVFKNTFTIIVLLLISFKIYKVYSKKTYYNRY